MTKITCTRQISFDAAHRVMLHEGKCKHLHGHRYTIEVTFQADELDTLGRVVDFGLIKEVLGAWVDTHWDHTLILWENDKQLGEDVATHTKQTVYYMPTNPTAENMALYLIETICPKLFTAHGVKCTHLTIHETPNCSASAHV
jgi:6-pyruvoyltetrahydropterin/6-carboxytetrahydropterin synthase